MGDIGILFIAGFGSSLVCWCSITDSSSFDASACLVHILQVFGTFAGSACDTAGRRKGCLGYAASYSLSCVLKHSPNYTILMVSPT
eukprot:SAG31_NODE_12_length_38498_cov_21.161671_23_plen_86_part_00